MTDLVQILLATTGVSFLALVGLTLYFLKEDVFRRVLGVMIAFAAGTLLGGAFLHLLPESIQGAGDALTAFAFALGGFTVLMVLELFMNFHRHVLNGHSHHHGMQKKPVTYMILLADAVHNFVGGLAIGSSFLVGTDVGLVTTFAAAAHEIPQELGDYGILVHGGWNKTRAAIANFLSALTVILGGIAAYLSSGSYNVSFLLPFAAGNFIYIAATDLIPEINHETNWIKSTVHFIAFVMGVLSLGVVRELGG